MSGQIYKVHDWIEKADHDLAAAKLIYLHLPEYSDTIAFHCQQAVEKYLKGTLVYLQIDFIRSHDLVYLLELINTRINIADISFKKAFTLSNYAVQIRYPEIQIKLSNTEIESAIEISQEFRSFALNITGFSLL